MVDFVADSFLRAGLVSLLVAVGNNNDNLRGTGVLQFHCTIITEHECEIYKYMMYKAGVLTYSLWLVSLLSIFVVLNLGDLSSHFLEILSPPPSAYDWCYEQPDSMPHFRHCTPPHDLAMKGYRPLHTTLQQGRVNLTHKSPKSTRCINVLFQSLNNDVGV